MLDYCRYAYKMYDDLAAETVTAVNKVSLLLFCSYVLSYSIAQLLPTVSSIPAPVHNHFGRYFDRNPCITVFLLCYYVF